MRVVPQLAWQTTSALGYAARLKVLTLTLSKGLRLWPRQQWSSLTCWSCCNWPVQAHSALGNTAHSKVLTLTLSKVLRVCPHRQRYNPICCSCHNWPDNHSGRTCALSQCTILNNYASLTLRDVTRHLRILLSVCGT